MTLSARSRNPFRRSAVRGRALAWLLALLAAFSGPSAFAECGTIDDPLQVLDVHLEIDPADWDVIRRDTGFDEERPGLFRCGDEGALPVMIRRKRSDAIPSDQDPAKVSLKIDFDDQIEAAPGLRPHFDRILRRLCEETMADANIDRLLDDMARTVGPAIEADPLHHLQGGFTAELERIRAWLKARTAFLRGILPPAEPSPLVLNEILTSNRDTNRDEAGEAADWVEIHNRGASEARLAGFFLSDDPARPLRWMLPDVVLPPGGRFLVWCDDDPGEGANHAPFQLDRDGESIGLYEESAGIVRVVDFIRFGPQETDRSLGRSPDGAALLVPLACPTPGLANAGECPRPIFLRGDCVDDGRVDVSDAVCLLNWLFRGAETPGCMAAANVTGSGLPSITDPIYLLTHLFLGGPALPAPFPGCGHGSLEVELGCLTPPESCL